MFLAEQKGLNNMVPSSEQPLLGDYTPMDRTSALALIIINERGRQARDRAQALKRLNAQRALEERRSKMGVVRAMLKPGFFGNQEGHSWAPAYAERCGLLFIVCKPDLQATYTSGHLHQWLQQTCSKGQSTKTAQAGVRSTPGFAGIDQR